jgi:phosphate transport system protein
MALGGLVEAMLLESVDLLSRCDLDGLESLGEAERQLKKKRLAIEMGSLQFIANNRPQGADLRRAVAVVEIASELERVGEHAKKVARANCLTVGHHLRKPVANIHRVGADVQAMLSRTLDAYARRDVTAVRLVMADAQAIDVEYRQVYQQLLAVMNSRPRVVTQAVYISRAAYNLKRAAERVAGICDWLYFSVVGSMEGIQLEPGHAEAHQDIEPLAATTL